MAKKSNPDKGLRAVSIDFAGKTRDIKFSHAAIGRFEEECNSVLQAVGAVKPGMMIFADGIMESWLGNAKIFSLALYHGLARELSLEEIDSAIDDYIDAGGKKLDLLRAIIRAYTLATNPSSLAFLERNWKISDERKAMLTEAQNQQIEVVEKALAEAKAKLIPGSQSTDLPG